ncbi:hypothetical protein B0H17DRAFT_1209420 [Mycena rosella]|uniref:Uncharacterized protein n=1 Tax=Mycena rosella TaxID=1033263 RepID=A0AAD7CYV0_MYCRO|nr:hypothetical protein B0H17DRAFT_1209420 [Mycena rosella]
MAYAVDPAAFSNYWQIVLDEICTAAMGVPLYGVFVVLFLVAIHLLYHRRAPGRLALLILTVAMAMLATAQFSLRIVTVSLALRMLELAVKDGWSIPPPSLSSVERLYNVLAFTEDAVLVANTVVTDGLLIYRCYLVWGRPRKRFLVVPVLLMLGTLGSSLRTIYVASLQLSSATGYVTSYDEDYATDGLYRIDPRIVFAINLFTNFVVMGLTAGRIWWITRAQGAVLGPEFAPRYNAAIAILLESGAIYCCGLVFQVVGLSVQNSYEIQTPVYLSHGTISQLVNVVPTLIVVRVGLGHTVPTTANTTTPGTRLRVNIPRPLRFASAGELECVVSETDMPLEDVGRK